MATTRKSTKPAVLETDEETTVAEQSPKQVIAAGIDRFLTEAGLEVQHARYKVMRAIAYTAFVNAINDGTFDELVDQAITEADDLPTGWGLERSVAEVKEAPAKKVAAKPAAKAKAAPTTAARPARKRPVR